jgi:NAD-dependent SIR2 family protein deacetylase
MDVNSAAKPSNPWDLFTDYLASCERILFLVGAGLSAPSGIKTWRGADDKWRNFNIRDLASPKTFQEDPVLVWTFYGARLQEVLEARPNAAHIALASFVQRHGGCLTVNQNVDGKARRQDR